MKKIVTTLPILLLLAGAVFWVSTHTAEARLARSLAALEGLTLDDRALGRCLLAFETRAEAPEGLYRGWFRHDLRLYDSERIRVTPLGDGRARLVLAPRRSDPEVLTEAETIAKLIPEDPQGPMPAGADLRQALFDLLSRGGALTVPLTQPLAEAPDGSFRAAAAHPKEAAFRLLVERVMALDAPRAVSVFTLTGSSLSGEHVVTSGAVISPPTIRLHLPSAEAADELAKALVGLFRKSCRG